MGLHSGISESHITMPTKNTFIFESLFFEVLKISEMEQNVPKL